MRLRGTQKDWCLGLMLGVLSVSLLFAVAGCSSAAGSGDSLTTSPVDTIVLLARGEAMFQSKAGDLSVGCAFCHGADARGRLVPSIRGKGEVEIRRALASVEEMKPIKLAEADIEAVAVYLEYLNKQP